MVTVLEIGGSVLAGSRGYQRAAAFIGRRLCEGAGERFLVVVSAHLPTLDFTRALAMADDGCALVQRHALEAAARHHLPLVVRSVDGERATAIN